MTDFDISRGPEVGKILRAVQTEQLEGKLTDKASAYQFIKDILSA